MNMQSVIRIVLMIGSGFLSGCANQVPDPHPAALDVPAAPRAPFAPATRNGVPVPSYGSGYNPVSGNTASGL